MQEQVFPPFGDPQHPSDDPRIERQVAAYQRAIEEKLDQGLAAIQQSGVALMHEIAAEVWRSAGGDQEATRSQILAELSRDQAIRGLIAHTDERMQSLTVRYASLEDSLAGIAESNRALKDVMARAAQTLLDVANSPAMSGVRDVHDLLDRVEQNLSATFELLDDRDRLLTERIREQIQEHDGLLAKETARIVEALEGYVTSGVDAMGRLAQHVQEQVQLSGMHDTQLTERLMAEVSAQLELMYERVTLESREMAQILQAREGPVHDMAQRLTELIELRIRGLAELARSDAQVLRRQIVEAAAAQDEALAQAMDDRLAVVADSMTGAIRATVDETTRRVTEATTRAVSGRVDEVIDSLAAIDDKLVERIDANMTRLAGQLDERLGDPRATAAATAETLLAIGAALDKLDEQSQRLQSGIDSSRIEARDVLIQSQAAAKEAFELSQRVTRESLERSAELAKESAERILFDLKAEMKEATDRSVASAQETRETVERALAGAKESTAQSLAEVRESTARSLAEVNESTARSQAEVRVVAGRSVTSAQETKEAVERALAELKESTVRSQAETQAALTQGLEQRIGGLARMIRSDNQILGQAVSKAAEQEAAKEVLRTVKDLQGQLPSLLLEHVERRFEAFAEQLHRESVATIDAMAKSNEVLAKKVEQIGERIGERYEEDMQEVIGSLGSALAQVGRRAAREDRIDLE